MVPERSPPPPSPPPPPSSSSSSPQPAAASTSAISGISNRRYLMGLSLVAAWMSCVVDPGTVGGIEEVRAVRVDDEVDALALEDGGARVEPGEQRALSAGRLLLDVLERLLPDVGGQLPHVLRHGGRGVDRDVHDHVGSQGLAQVDR